jgi:hypothetical protein
MIGVLFLAVPGVPLRRRLENLGWAVLIAIFFDIFLIFFFVKATYAARLGAWSLSHYGAFARNFWGLGHHLLDLPFKFSLPFVLWIAFYYEDLTAGIRSRPPARLASTPTAPNS